MRGACAIPSIWYVYASKIIREKSDHRLGFLVFSSRSTPKNYARDREKDIPRGGNIGIKDIPNQHYGPKGYPLSTFGGGKDIPKGYTLGMKNKSVLVKMTDEEHGVITENAAGAKIATYMRNVALAGEKDIPAEAPPKSDASHHKDKTWGEECWDTLIVALGATFLDELAAASGSRSDPKAWAAYLRGRALDTVPRETGSVVPRPDAAGDDVKAFMRAWVPTPADEFEFEDRDRGPGKLFTAADGSPGRKRLYAESDAFFALTYDDYQRFRDSHGKIVPAI